MMDIIYFLGVASSLIHSVRLVWPRGRHFEIIEDLGMLYKSYDEPYVMVVRLLTDTILLICAARYACCYGYWLLSIA